MNVPAPTYQTLRDRGVAHIETLSSHVWTDYNIHDPGITLLEHLCYALTDLLYRLEHPLEDLLANPSTAGLGDEVDYPAEAILPCRPLTVLDYRKILIDLPGVRNAWLDLEALDSPPIYIDCDEEKLTLEQEKAEGRIVPRGFYRVLIDCEENLPSAEVPDLLDKARALLQQRRNLCEDFLSVEKVNIEEIGICAEIEAAQDADLERLHAEVVHGLETFIAPCPRFYSLAERRGLGMSSEEVLNGPLLQHGFLDDAELIASERYAELHLSDLIQIVMDVKGVLAVRDLSASSYRDGTRVQAGERWVLRLDPKRTARLVLTAAVDGGLKKVTRLLFFKSGVPFQADQNEVTVLLSELRANDRHHRDIDNQATYELPHGVWPDSAVYHSLQNDLPPNYGIGRAGLPNSATAARKAQALQLKAYLLLFEQFLANFLAQLAAMRRLFSLADLPFTFHAQLPFDVPELNRLLVKTPGQSLAYLHAIGETDAGFFRRRHRFLDHLLARVGERFNDDALIARRLHGNKAERHLLRDKMRMLKNYPSLSANRASAMDYTQVQRSYSGLEDYLHTLFGAVTDFFEIYLNPSENKFRWRLRVPGEGILLYGTKPFAKRTEAAAAAAGAAKLVGEPANYLIEQAVNDKFYAFLGDGREKLARVPGLFDEKATLEEEIAKLLRFRADYPPGKRIVLIEHILLRPRPGTTGLLPACIRKIDGECCGEDPYSFRVSIFLPFWLPQFQNMPFRGFVEQTIRDRLPAHLFAKICWIGRQEMADLETKHREWRLALAAKPVALPAAQDALIHCMAQLRSHFPQATLHDCVEGEDENPIVLGNATLGTFKPEDRFPAG